MFPVGHDPVGWTWVFPHEIQPGDLITYYVNGQSEVGIVLRRDFFPGHHVDQQLIIFLCPVTCRRGVTYRANNKKFYCKPLHFT
jgi:hypothetical protein